jgi:hypothetical protein
MYCGQSGYFLNKPHTCLPLDPILNQVLVSVVVKVKVKATFTLEQALKVRGVGGVEIWLYSFFNLSARWGSVVNGMPRPLGKRPGTHLQEAGWAPGLVWKGAEGLAPT